MTRDDVILLEDNLASPKSIQENAIPRNGGRWPEYCHTMLLRVDGFENELARGRLYSFCA